MANFKYKKEYDEYVNSILREHGYASEKEAYSKLGNSDDLSVMLDDDRLADLCYEYDDENDEAHQKAQKQLDEQIACVYNKYADDISNMESFIDSIDRMPIGILKQNALRETKEAELQSLISKRDSEIESLKSAFVYKAETETETVAETVAETEKAYRHASDVVCYAAAQVANMTELWYSDIIWNGYTYYEVKCEVADTASSYLGVPRYDNLKIGGNYEANYTIKDAISEWFNLETTQSYTASEILEAVKFELDNFELSDSEYNVLLAIVYAFMNKSDNSENKSDDSEYCDDPHDMFEDIINKLKTTDTKDLKVVYSDDYTNLKISIIDKNSHSYNYRLVCYDGEYVSYIRKFVIIYKKHTINNDNSTAKIMAIQRFYDLHI